MSTRWVVARPDGQGGWWGRYGHFDGYCRGVGKALWDVYHAEAQGDIEDMLRFYMLEHPAGWSSITRRQKDPRREPDRFWSQGRYPGTCYCHRNQSGARGPERVLAISSAGDHCGAEYAYILDPERRIMAIHAFTYGGAPLYAPRGWRLLATIDLDGPEPDWRALDSR